MKSLLKKHVIPAALIVTVFASNFLLLSIPKLAQADSGTACQGGTVVAIAAYAWAKIKDTVGVPAGPGQAEQGLANNRQSASSFINDCILKPLAQMMIVALIRNIGASVVNWVNTGFQGKPAFITDLGGTLLDAADQAAGNFIEGSDLAFLCSPFSFQIRIALALKYSQPFNEQVRCTLTDISNNVSNFANNNGGAGWDNWMKITTEPQNNVYGAYLIADSELAKRMANAVGVKQNKITLGQGFLDFETCDEYETPSEAAARVAGASNPLGAQQQASINSFGANTSSFENFNTGQQAVYGFGSASTTVIGTVKAPLPTFNQTLGASVTPQCKPGKMTTKTPGQVIASQLNSEFATGPIQRAVAQEIDQVISATLNQLAQKAIQGASGLLGLSQKSSSNSSSYLARYRAQYYGQTNTASVGDTGAQTPLDAYTLNSYDASLALRNDPTNPDIQNINQFTDTAGGSQIQAQNNQFSSTIAAFGDTSPVSNVALGKSSTESSVLNAAANGNDGIKQASQYIKGAETAPNEPGGWWEVDLGANTSIEKINIYQNATPSAPNGGLGTFVVDVRSEGGATTTYPMSAFSTDSSTGALTGTIGQTGRYVRITRQASETSCPNDYYGSTYSEAPCADQPHLAFAELEVMEKASVPSNATSTADGAINTSTGSTAAGSDAGTATSTLSWNPPLVSGLTVSAAQGMAQEIKLASVQAASGLVVDIALYDANGRNIPFSSVFDNFDILRGPTGGSWVSTKSVITQSVGDLRMGLSMSQNSSFSFKITGDRGTGAAAGSYSFISQVTDSTGMVLQDKTQRTNFVVE